MRIHPETEACGQPACDDTASSVGAPAPVEGRIPLGQDKIKPDAHRRKFRWFLFVFTSTMAGVAIIFAASLSALGRHAPEVLNDGQGRYTSEYINHPVGAWIFVGIWASVVAGILVERYLDLQEWAESHPGDGGGRTPSELCRWGVILGLACGLCALILFALVFPTPNRATFRGVGLNNVRLQEVLHTAFAFIASVLFFLSLVGAVSLSYARDCELARLVSVDSAFVGPRLALPAPSRPTLAGLCLLALTLPAWACLPNALAQEQMMWVQQWGSVLLALFAPIMLGCNLQCRSSQPSCSARNAGHRADDDSQDKRLAET